MPLETATYISSLVATNPQTSDQQNQGDDHLRLIKAALLATFPNITGAVTATHTAINSIAGWLTSGAVILATAGAFFSADADTGVRNPAADQLALRTGGADRLLASNSGVAITGNASVSGSATVTGLQTAGAFGGGSGELVPVGTVLDYAGATEPTGYLFCYGQAVSRTTYAALFAALSTTYGTGNGTTTFNLPDLRGRVCGGKDNMGGVAANNLDSATTLGGAQGTKTHTLTIAQLPVVTPAGTVAAPTITAKVDGSIRIPNTGSTFDPVVGSGGSNNTTAITASAPAFTGTPFGSGNAHPIVQPTMILNKIIKF